MQTFSAKTSIIFSHQGIRQKITAMNDGYYIIDNQRFIV